MQTTTFRRVALAEAVSYLLLLVATAVKYGAGNELGVRTLGPIHGVLALVYAVGVLAVREEQGWNAGTTVVALVASAVPFGGFLVERRLVRRPATAPR